MTWYERLVDAVQWYVPMPMSRYEHTEEGCARLSWWMFRDRVRLWRYRRVLCRCGGRG